MTTKAKPTQPSVNAISNCNFTANNAANEHTRAAVLALAAAAQANAEAISSIASALKGSAAMTAPMLSITGTGMGVGTS